MIDPLLATVQVEVICTYRSILRTEWVQPHGHDPYGRIYYITSGEGFLTINDQSFVLKPGELYLIPAYTTFTYHCPRQVGIDWVHFSSTLQTGMDLFAYKTCDWKIKPSNPRHILHLLAQLRIFWNSGKISEPFQTRGLLLQLLSPFLETAKDNALQKKYIERFWPVLEMIEQRWRSPLTVPELARLVHLEPSYFSREFRNYFGIPPLRYILQRKIKEAQKILNQSDDTLNTISQTLGFTDAFHFSRTFHRFTGLWPSQFRRQTRQKRLP